MAVDATSHPRQRQICGIWWSR